MVDGYRHKLGRTSSVFVPVWGITVAAFSEGSEWPRTLRLEVIPRAVAQGNLLYRCL